MQSILLIVTAGTEIQMPTGSGELLCGYRVPLLEGEVPSSRALQLCNELQVQPDALTHAGSLHIYRVTKRAYRYDPVDWQSLEQRLPCQRVTLFHASTPATRSRGDVQMLCESVPYAELRPTTKHWLPFVLLGEGVHAHLVEALDGATHSTKLESAAVTRIALRNTPTLVG